LKIGRKIKVLTDKTRKIIERGNELDRQLIISIFYPLIEETLATRKSSYLDLFSPHVRQYIDIVFRDLNNAERTKHYQYLDGIKMNFLDEPDVNEHGNEYPVIIFSPGFMMDRDSSSLIIEQLVSKKFIVITMGHLHETPLTFFPNGEIIESSIQQITDDEKNQLIVDRAKDIEFLIDMIQMGKLFKDKLNSIVDKSNLCLIGHSFGGAASYKYSLCNKNIKALVLWDASLQYFDDLSKYEELNIPVLNFRRGLCNYTDEIEHFINEHSMKMSSEEYKTRLATRKTVSRRQFDGQQKLNKSISAKKSFIKLNASEHMSFTDYPIVSHERDENNINQSYKFYSLISEVTTAFLHDVLCIGKVSYELKLEKYLGNEIDMI